MFAKLQKNAFKFHLHFNSFLLIMKQLKFFGKNQIFIIIIF